MGGGGILRVQGESSPGSCTPHPLYLAVPLGFDECKAERTSYRLEEPFLYLAMALWQSSMVCSRYECPCLASTRCAKAWLSWSGCRRRHPPAGRANPLNENKTAREEENFTVRECGHFFSRFSRTEKVPFLGKKRRFFSLFVSLFYSLFLLLVFTPCFRFEKMACLCGSTD